MIQKPCGYGIGRYHLFVCLLCFLLCSAGLPALAAQSGQGSKGEPKAGDETKKTLQQAADAYKIKDYAKTKTLLKPLAERNNPHAAFAMGHMAVAGQGGAQDVKAAEGWWKKAAESGNVQALYNLGWIYYSGALGQPDTAKAREFWIKAARTKHADALYSLAVLQFNGDGGPKDTSAALKNFQQAASLGHPRAAYELGQAYLEGKAVTRDSAKGRELLKRAADKGLQEAKTALLALGEEKPSREVSNKTASTGGKKRGAANTLSDTPVSQKSPKPSGEEKRKSR